MSLMSEIRELLGLNPQEKLKERYEDWREEGGERLDWEHSVVDLLKLLDKPASFGARSELAAELGVEHYGDDAESNERLHAAVMAKLV